MLRFDIDQTILAGQAHIIATKPKIVFGLRTERPLKTGKAPKRLLRLLEDFSRLMPSHEVQLAHIAFDREAHAMNLLIEQFRNDPDAEWLVWFNDRAEITAEELCLLFEPKLAVCGALGTTTKDPAEWLASFYPDVKPDEKGILPVPELGAVVKLYHRQVFDLIENAVPGLTYIYDASGRSLAAFCQEKLEEFSDYKRLLPPAYHLDSLCRKAKIGIFAHTRVVVPIKGHDDHLYPKTEPYRSWDHTRLPPPICAEDLPSVPYATDLRDILICVQYCDKDKQAAERLAQWIKEQVGFSAWLVYSPGDQYPKGPNQTALGLLRKDWPDYRGILLLEPDCVSVTPDWLEQLSRDWDRCRAAGKLLMGSWHPINSTHPTLGHLNGNLMFHPSLWKKLELPDVPDSEPWDTYLAQVFQPHWARTGLIKNLNRHKTATTRQMMAPECGSKTPVLIHGVKDESAWNYARTLCVSKSSA